MLNMRSVRMAAAALLVVCLAGCESRYIIPNNYVLAHPNLFLSDLLKNRKVFLVFDADLKDYQMYEGRVTLELGASVSAEVWALCKALFSSVDEVPYLEKAKQRLWNKTDCIVVPVIRRAFVRESLLPYLGNLEAELAIEYSFYDGAGELIATDLVVGHGKRHWTGSRSYEDVMRLALQDVITKSANKFLSVLQT